MIYHLYIETLTGVPFDKKKSIREYWDKLPEEFRIKEMKNFLWKLALYPERTSLEEVKEAWEKVREKVVIFRPLPPEKQQS
jgi:hypothetical protein